MGIYIHIPFCRKACTYCDFHFSTRLDYKQRMVRAIIAELEMQKGTHPGVVRTIYFGGGTPSVLGRTEISSILSIIRSTFEVTDDAEITLEANPDDLTSAYLNDLKECGVNRLSIGVQSFDNEVLQWMNRSHNTDQSVHAIREAQSIGFKNITADLIFGIPDKGNAYWSEQLDKAIGLNIDHLSVYSLTVEEKTVLDHRIRKGLQNPPLPENQAEQFIMAMDRLAEEGYEQYEISNYARTGYRSRHNSSYWSGEPYLGIGPSAHSFDGRSKRAWNVASNHRYMQGIESGQAIRESEELSVKDRVNELILTRLRTVEGLSLSYCEKETGHKVSAVEYNNWIDSGKLVLKDDHLMLTMEGKLIADAIASSLFIL